MKNQLVGIIFGVCVTLFLHVFAPSGLSQKSGAGRDLGPAKPRAIQESGAGPVYHDVETKKPESEERKFSDTEIPQIRMGLTDQELHTGPLTPLRESASEQAKFATKPIAPDAPSPSKFSFKKIFGSSKKTSSGEVSVVKKSPVSPVRQEFKPRAFELPQVQAFRQSVAEMPPESFQRIDDFRSGLLKVKDLSPDEARRLIDFGDKILAMSKDDLAALSPEEKLKAYATLEARAIQFQMGENLAANVGEGRAGIARVRAQRAKEGAAQDVLDRMDAQIAQKDKDFQALSEMYGYKPEDATQTKVALNQKSHDLGSEFDIRMELLSARKDEVDQIAGQRTLTPAQIQTCEAFYKNALELTKIKARAEGDADPQKIKAFSERKQRAEAAVAELQAELEKGLREGFKDRGEVAVRNDLKLRQETLTACKSSLESVESSKTQIDGIAAALDASKKSLKKLMPSFMASQGAKVKALQKSIDDKKAELNKILPQLTKDVEALNVEKDGLTERKVRLIEQMGKDKDLLRYGRRTDKDDESGMPIYEVLSDVERVRLEDSVSKREAEISALDLATRDVQGKIDGYQSRTQALTGAISVLDGQLRRAQEDKATIKDLTR